MSNLHLPEKPTLKQFQAYVHEMCAERGFDKEGLAESFILFTEEVGEFARVVRKSQGYKTDVTVKNSHAEEELADLFIYIIHLANILDIDLERAFRMKEEINKQRTWN